jgi:hypothetical protein
MLRIREKTGSDHPETRAPVLAGGRRRRWPPATLKSESGATRIEALAKVRADSRPRCCRPSGAVAAAGAGGRDGGGFCRSRIRRVEEPSESHAGFLVVSGPARTVPPPLEIILIAARSGHEFRAGTIVFCPSLWAPGLAGGPGRRSGSPRGDRTTGRDRLAPLQTRPEPPKIVEALVSAHKWSEAVAFRGTLDRVILTRERRVLDNTSFYKLFKNNNLRRFSAPSILPRNPMAHRMLFPLTTQHSGSAEVALPDRLRRAGGIETNHEQASFSLAVPGPLGGGRAFFLYSLLYK